MSLTYQDLFEQLEKLTPEQRAQSVTVFDLQEEEFYPVNKVEFTGLDDTLDEDHPILVFNHVE